MHAFPTIEQLLAVDEAAFRALGFGYRARFFVETAAQLHALGGEPWMRELRRKPAEEVQEALLWNRKRVLGRRFAGAKRNDPDAPPVVFFAGELIVSVVYRKGQPMPAMPPTSIVPLSLAEETADEDRDFLEVTIKKIAAHGDDGSHAGSSAQVWAATFAVILYFTVGVLVYVYVEGMSFVDSLWFCVATITTVGT